MTLLKTQNNFKGSIALHIIKETYEFYMELVKTELTTMNDIQNKLKGISQCLKKVSTAI